MRFVPLTVPLPVRPETATVIVLSARRELIKLLLFIGLAGELILVRR